MYVCIDKDTYICCEHMAMNISICISKVIHLLKVPINTFFLASYTTKI